MSIQNSRIVLDTNVWIYGLRRDQIYPQCEELLDKLRMFRVIIPRQVLFELQVNLSPQEYQQFWQLINAYPAQIEVSWDPAPQDRLDRYRQLGCRKGDAAVAALTEHVEAEVLVRENRELLRDVSNLPFRLVSSTELLAELER